MSSGHVDPMTPDLERIAIAVLACPAVAGLHSGRFGTTVTHLPVGRLVGLSVKDAVLVVGVIGVYPAGVAEIAAQVRAAVADHAPGMDVVVNVEDLYIRRPETEA